MVLDINITSIEVNDHYTHSQLYVYVMLYSIQVIGFGTFIILFLILFT